MRHFNLKDIIPAKNKRGVPSRTVVDRADATIKELLLEAGESIPPHEMPMDVTFFVLEGEGTITIGEHAYPVKPLDIVLCPPGTSMAVKAGAKKKLYFLNIKTPGLNA